MREEWWNHATLEDDEDTNFDLIHIHKQIGGDDCISIQLGTSNVQIYDVHCKPGHGYNIGGLGFDKNVAQVSNVYGGSGFVQSILFSNIHQNYCGGPKICPSTNDTNAVAISGVTYKNITGTYLCRVVSLVCSKYKPCENITIDTIDLIPSVGTMNKCMGHPICSNVFGTLINNTTPPLKDCLLSEAQPPALPPIAQPPAMPQKLF
ncbi:hypothetical protein ACJIZ3_006186 [Penstemon smallii]|uniref:Polygalacturonase n=1 Tax=Penstemon smallii TaxID=265156 RepID=A0ABD3S6Y8_9LAMI